MGKSWAFCLVLHYGRTFEINDIAVDPQYQGRGIASQLLECCKSDIKEPGIVGLHLIIGTGNFLPEFQDRSEVLGFYEHDKLIGFTLILINEAALMDIITVLHRHTPEFD